MAILPELILLTGALAFFAVSLSKELKAEQISNSAIFLGVLTAIGALVSFNQETTVFNGCYQVDMYSQFFKLMISLGLVFVLIAGQNLKGIRISVRPEYYMFLFLSCLGLMSLVSSVELITLFVSLELSSFALYLLVPMRDDQGGIRVQMEAGIKYVLFGVLATGFMLYGMSYIFGLTGTTYFNDIVPGLQAAPPAAAFFSVVMVLSAFFYKLAIFPMHFWVPDVYEGASNETTAFVATVPKLGAVAMMIRFVIMVPGHAEILVPLLMVLALCSMFYGNLIALVQTDVKRMLGYSGIAHAGFILLGLLTLNSSGYATVMYYISGYVFMNIACYMVLGNVSVEGENVAVSDLNGLYKRQPMMAFLLAVGLFALAGIPPMVGFMGEFLLLAGALKAGHLVLVVLAAINAGIAIYYYLRVVKAAFTADPEDRADVEINGMTKFGSVALVLIILLMGAFPSKIIAFADTAVKSIM
jgi:NADH-quinone oxidoreductase subunit N